MSLVLLEPSAMAELDRRTIEELGVPGLVLMESAAAACVRALLLRWPTVARAGGVFVVAGPGNNGGDGLAIARRLSGLGVRVEVALLGLAATLAGDAAVQWRMLRAVDVPHWEVADRSDLHSIVPRMAGALVLVDALFGTGLCRPLTPLAAELVRAMNAAQAAGAGVLSVDIPSGVHGGTGGVLGAAVSADLTVTFAAGKLAHFTGPGRSLRGDLVLADIGIPTHRFSGIMAAGVRLLEPRDLVAVTPPAPRDAHKGTFGHVLVVAGGPGKAGAARLASEAALRAGAGLVTLAIAEGLALDSLAGLRPEIMVARVPGEADGSFGARSLPALLRLAVGKGAVGFGPGIGTSASAVELVRRVMGELAAPLVVDADALNCLSTTAWPAGPFPGPRVLTPHPGELARLLPPEPGSEPATRLEAARTLATRSRCVVVLKGAGTLVLDVDGTAALNPTGNPGMGTGGTGDVLTGVLAALLARGVPAAAAAAAAVFWHGLAGDLARNRLGEIGLRAGDLSEALPEALQAAHAGTVELSVRCDPPAWRP